MTNNPKGKWNFRTNVTNGQTFGGNSWKINFAHISKFSKSQWEISHSILLLAEYRLFSRKLIITEFHQNAAFEAQNFRRISERCVTNWKTIWTDKKYQILKNSIKIYFVGNLSNPWRFIYKGNWIYPTNFWLHKKLNLSNQLLTT